MKDAVIGFGKSFDLMGRNSSQLPVQYTLFTGRNSYNGKKEGF